MLEHRSEQRHPRDCHDQGGDQCRRRGHSAPTTLPRASERISRPRRRSAASCVAEPRPLVGAAAGRGGSAPRPYRRVCARRTSTLQCRRYKPRPCPRSDRRGRARPGLQDEDVAVDVRRGAAGHRIAGQGIVPALVPVPNARIRDMSLCIVIRRDHSPRSTSAWAGQDGENTLDMCAELAHVGTKKLLGR